MNDDFFQQALKQILDFNAARLSIQGQQYVIQLAQGFAQGQTVSQFLDQISPDDPLKPAFQRIFYLVPLVGFVNIVEQTNGINDAQAEDLRSYLLEMNRIEMPMDPLRPNS